MNRKKNRQEKKLNNIIHINNYCCCSNNFNVLDIITNKIFNHICVTPITPNKNILLFNNNSIYSRINDMLTITLRILIS